jgi:hypothetical protein
LWSQSGSTNAPFDWSRLNPDIVAALVPQPDGSFKSFSGAAGPNGTFEIPNVPAGYYWLRLGPRDTYWTSSSIFDMSSDVFVTTATPTTSVLSTTYLNFNFTSLEATAAAGVVQVDFLESIATRYSGSTKAGSTTFTGTFGIGSNLDFSVIKNAYVRQYEPTAFGSINGYILGPALTLSNLSLTTGSPNAISGALNPTVPTSVNLSVKGSAWVPLFDHIAPTAPTALEGSIYLSAQPYIPTDGPNVSSTRPIDLLWTSGSCAAGNFTGERFSAFLVPSLTKPLTTDVEAGTVQYSDPFPTAWRRTFSVCQAASVDVPVPGGQTQTIHLLNTQTTTLPTTAVKPLISSVQNPKINDASLFTAATVNGTAVTLSWDPPAIGTPFGYTVAIMSPTTLQVIAPVGTFPVGTSPISTIPVVTSPGTIIGTIAPVEFLSATTLSTAKTSLTVPPGLLRSGQTYLFVITSLVDGKANMETSPHRSSLPAASAQLVSAPVTIAN